MKRRWFLLLSLATLAAFGVAHGQARQRFRLGVLLGGNETAARALLQALSEGLREKGYVVGDNLALDVRYAEGDAKRYLGLADELIALRPDAVLGVETAALAVASRTKSIPIVLLTSIDPVSAGLVKSLARPGTNVTGMTDQFDQMIAKQVDLMNELVPKLSRVALVIDPGWSAAQRYERFAREAAQRKGLMLTVVSIRPSNDMREICDSLARERPGGLVVGMTGQAIQRSREIFDCVRTLRLPAIYGLAMFTENGGLLSYGPNLIESTRTEVAGYIAQILKGARPADMPVQQTTRYEFAINLRAAREIGLTVPPSILVRADRVIE